MECQLKAQEHNILPFYFPSHLTHVLQPLDTGIFRPWKHYHSLAIQSALRSLDFEYTITSFMRDLTSMREQTFKWHTIMNSFKNSGIWPVPAKQGIKKKRTITDVQAEDDNIQLPYLPPSRPQDIKDTATTIRALNDRDPTQFSDNTVQSYHCTLTTVDI